MPFDPLELVGGIAIGTGVGQAVGDVVVPQLRELKYGQSAKFPVVPLAAEIAAEIAAENVDAYDRMAGEALQFGYNADRFRDLYGVILNAPGMGELLAMMRRGTISGGDFAHGLRKARYEPRWDAALEDLRHEYIGIGDIAMAIVRGILPAPAYVPVAPPTHGDKVPRYPVVPVDPEALAAKLGYDAQMLEIMVGRSGLSLAPVMAANALFRNIIGPDDFLMAVAEGDLRTEWADTLREVSRQILTSGQYAELQLRGFLTQAQRRTKTAQHGMTNADSDLLYDLLGRSINVHAITTGLARGGTFNGPTGNIPAEYLQSLERGNLRPEYYSLAYANRFSYPSAFVIRSLLTDGVLSERQGEEIFLEIGWRPDLAKQVAQAYAVTQTAGGDKHVQKAQTQLWNTTHTSYKGYEISAPTARQALTAAGVTPSAVPQVLAIWDEERQLIRKTLTAKQLVKLVSSQAVNPATNAPWTSAEIMPRLLELGYDQADATSLLELT